MIEILIEINFCGICMVCCTRFSVIYGIILKSYLPDSRGLEIDVRIHCTSLQFDSQEESVLDAVENNSLRKYEIMHDVFDISFPFFDFLGSNFPEYLLLNFDAGQSSVKNLGVQCKVIIEKCVLIQKPVHLLEKPLVSPT